MLYLNIKYYIYLVQKYDENKFYKVKSCFYDMYRYEKNN